MEYVLKHLDAVVIRERLGVVRLKHLSSFLNRLTRDALGQDGLSFISCWCSHRINVRASVDHVHRFARVSSDMRPTRTVHFALIDGHLRRTVVRSDGRTYTHHCTRAVYEAVAYAMEDGQGHTAQEISRTLDLPFTQVDVAFQFLKERGVIETRHKRRSYAASKCVYEDAMVELLALNEQN